MCCTMVEKGRHWKKDRQDSSTHPCSIVLIFVGLVTLLRGAAMIDRVLHVMVYVKWKHEDQ